VSLAHRTEAEEDFEVTLRRRRTTEAAASAEQRAAADAAAAQTISDAKAQAGKLVDDATSEVRRLDGHRDTAHAQLRELHARLGAALDEALADTPPAP